jgi:hypothetical protein
VQAVPSARHPRQCVHERDRCEGPRGVDVPEWPPRDGVLMRRRIRGSRPRNRAAARRGAVSLDVAQGAEGLVALSTRPRENAPGASPERVFERGTAVGDGRASRWDPASRTKHVRSSARDHLPPGTRKRWSRGRMTRRAVRRASSRRPAHTAGPPTFRRRARGARVRPRAWTPDTSRATPAAMPGPRKTHGTRNDAS